MLFHAVKVLLMVFAILFKNSLSILCHTNFESLLKFVPNPSRYAIVMTINMMIDDESYYVLELISPTKSCSEVHLPIY